jgi:hypothetical protein
MNTGDDDVSHTGDAAKVNAEEQTMAGRGYRVANKAIMIAPAAFVLAIVACWLLTDSMAQAMSRFMHAYLVNFAFFLSLVLGGLFFVLVNHVTRSGWNVTCRRQGEMLGTMSRLMAILFIPLALYVLSPSGGDLYPWAASRHEAASTTTADAHAEVQDADAVHGGGGATAESGHGHALIAGSIDPETEAYYAYKKSAWLNKGFFIGRWVLYFAIWIYMGMRLWRGSVAQDTSGDAWANVRLEKFSGPMIPVFALTLTFASFDLMMSTSPAWYSTMFGVYYFAGSALGLFALLILMSKGLQSMGYLKGSMTTEHYHDLAKWMFTFVFFWGYIAFSQYMLIWYANMPETTFWFQARGATTVASDVNGWSYVILFLLFGHFLVPFVGMLSRHVKRNGTLLALWAAWLLLMHWVDMWWLIMPEYSTHVPLPLPELLLLAGMGSLFFYGGVRKLAQASLIPVNDPRLGEALAFENL